MAPLPAEICGIICNLTNRGDAQRDLMALCKVDRAFRLEAEPLLYTRVSLRNLRCIKSWASTLCLHPHLAPRTRSIRMSLPPMISIDDAELSKLMRALRACINLQSLGIFPEIPRDVDSVGCWILEDLPFQLTAFANGYFSLVFLRKFFQQQQAIRTLDISSVPMDRSLLINGSFPRLHTIHLDFDALRALASGGSNPKKSPTRHLLCRVSSPAKIIDIVEFRSFFVVGWNLTSLSIQGQCGFRGTDINRVFQNVATHLPHLLEFSLLDDNQFDSCDVQFMPNALSFKKLQTLIFRPATYRTSCDVGTILTIFPDINTDTGRNGTASRLMASMSTLMSFVLIIGDVKYPFVRSDTNIDEVYMAGSTVEDIPLHVCSDCPKIFPL